MKVKLKETGKIITGNTPKTSEAENYSSNDIPFIKPSDIHENDILRIGESEYWISEHARKKARILPPNSVLVTCIGIIGKVAINTCECAFNQQINAIIPDSERYLPEYIAYAILSKQKYLQEIANAPVVPIINKSQFADIDIQTIDIQAQKRVVDKLSSVSELIKLNNYRLNKLDELIKSRFIEMFDKTKYPLIKAKDICYYITKGTTPAANELFSEYAIDRVPFLKVYNLSFTGELLFDQAPQFISLDTHNNKLSRSIVYPNDVLMNIVGPPLGKFTLVTNDYPEWNINQAIAIFRAKDNVNPYYLMHALMQPIVLRPFLDNAVGIRQLNLSLEQCRNLEIPLPPIKLQSQFADFVTQVEKQKATVQQSIDKLEILKKSLMQDYFG